MAWDDSFLCNFLFLRTFLSFLLNKPSQLSPAEAIEEDDKARFNNVAAQKHFHGSSFYALRF
ncbi:hypothetical protein KFK09_008923 [Dendrobium nobile]|uniref:Uncharacterized protein n=1 Tax=Dendrobium nobile TaxID=94219 RepID=A0A8T3BM22_DENNO|nr:hypothetical protein KFK09_008923 [Dendrobium nobile]